MITELEKYKNYSHFKSLLKDFYKLDLKLGEYAIFGSGPLAIRGLVFANDIDIIINDKCKFYEYIKNKGVLKIDNIEMFIDWPGFEVSNLIDDCDIIEGISFVKLKDVLKHKKSLNRKKDTEALSIFKDLDL